MGRLFLLFIVVPIVELGLLLRLGEWMGALPTLGLIITTGALGAYLARRQGLGVLRRAQEEMDAGRLPAGQLVEGLLIFVAGALLMTPGVLTDAFGFFCLIPAGRRLLKGYLLGLLERSVRDGKVTVGFGFPSGPSSRPHEEPIDVTPRSEGAGRVERPGDR